MVATPASEPPSETQVRLARIIAHRSRLKVGSFLDYEDLVQEAWFHVNYLWNLFDASHRHNNEAGREPFIIGYGTHHLRRNIVRQVNRLSAHKLPGDIPAKSYPPPIHDTPTELAERFGKGMTPRRKQVLRLLAEGKKQVEIAKILGTTAEVPSYYVRKFRREGR